MVLREKSEHTQRIQATTKTRLVNGLLLVLLLGVSYVQLDIVAAGFISLILTPLSMVVEPGSLARLQFSRLLEYWIAALVWILAAAVLLRRVVVKKMKGPPKRTGVLQRLLDSASEKIGQVGLGFRAILLFGFVASSAPFLAPWDPVAQGALPTTRLLPPLSQAAYVEFASGSEVSTAGPIATKVSNANSYLLNRLIKFSALEQDDIPNAPRPEGMRVVRRGERLFLLGTDHLGRDLLSRIIYGTRVSLGIALVAALGAVVAGAFVGFVAGSAGGIIERLLMRLLDVLLAIPSLFFILAVIAFLGSNIMIMTGVLIALGWMTPARIIRTEVAGLREREFILSAKLLGVTKRRIVLDHMLPNILPVILTSLLLQFSTMVLAEATLSFLGLGVQPPTPSWGSIIGEATGYLHIAWWIALFPGIVISSLIVAAYVALEGWQHGHES